MHQRRLDVRFERGDSALVVVEHRSDVATYRGDAVAQRFVPVGDDLEAVLHAFRHDVEVLTCPLGLFVDVLTHALSLFANVSRRRERWQFLLDAPRPRVEILEKLFDVELIHRLTTPCG
jgi:hypothetical protein